MKEFCNYLIQRTTEKLCLLIEQLKELSIESNIIHKVDKVAQNCSGLVKDLVNLLRLSLHPN